MQAFEIFEKFYLNSDEKINLELLSYKSDLAESYSNVGEITFSL